MYYWADRDVVNQPDLIQLGLYFQYSATAGDSYMAPSYDDREYTARWVTDAGQLPSMYFGQNLPGAGVDPHNTNTTYVEVKGSSAFGPLGWRKGTRASSADHWVWERHPPLDVANCYL